MLDIEKQPLSAVIGRLLGSKVAFTDLHIESGQPISIRRSAGNWETACSSDRRPIIASHEKILAFINAIYTQEETVRSPQGKPASWERELEMSGSLHPAGVLFGDGDIRHRVRCTIQRQSMGEALGLVIRSIREVPESISSLGLPIQLSRMIRDTSHGLIVVTGPTGSGKSTSIAAMLQEINKERHSNILTIEDPIEFEFERVKSIFNQRELHVDVPTFERGVRDALRFVPDIIMVGETRDSETMRAVLRAAESGHLVLTTMHAPTTAAAIRKMLSYLDNNAADIQSLSGCLVGIVAQALIRPVERHRPNALAYELLNCQDSAVQSALASGRAQDEIKNVENKLRQRQLDGSLPLIESLRNLVKNSHITAKMAAAAAQLPEDKTELLRMGQGDNARPHPQR